MPKSLTPHLLLPDLMGAPKFQPCVGSDVPKLAKRAPHALELPLSCPGNMMIILLAAILLGANGRIIPGVTI